MKVLVTAATKHGATAEIAATIGDLLRLNHLARTRHAHQVVSLSRGVACSGAVHAAGRPRFGATGRW
jgi:menaquinone-dependent protoporphyrinogen IX oxidase